MTVAHVSARLQRRVLLGTGAVGLLTFIFNCGSTGTPPQQSSGTPIVTVAPAATGLDTPLDATPDPMGTQIYFIANTGGMKAIFSVSAAGGTPAMLYMGAPLVNPVGISTSSDGKTLYIADPGAGTNGGGAVFSMPSAGNTPVVVAGSDGLHPTALDVAEAGSSDDLYLTGATTGGVPAVYKLAAEGGTPEVVIMGAPLVKPNGVSVTTGGSIFVADKAAGKMLPGQAFEVSNGQATTFGPEVEPGSPTGIAASLDGFIVLTSALDPTAGTSQVEIVTVKNGHSSVYNDVIKTNTVSGGLHRARFKDVYAWAGKTQVYAIRITRILSDSSTIGGVGVD